MLCSVHVAICMYIKTHDSESRGQEEAGRTRDEQVIKTHDSESRGQEEAGRTRDEQVSYLHVAPL